jgi:hypothetical protein
MIFTLPFIDKVLLPSHSLNPLQFFSSLWWLLGLNLVEKGKSRQILRQFHLQELHKWGYKPGILFYFEAKLDGKELSTVEFGTRDGLAMAHLLTDYVDAFLQEAEIEKSRTGGSTSTPPDDTSPAPATAGNGSSTDTPRSSRKSSAGSTPALTKCPSLPPPPPPPRPVTMSAPQRSTSSASTSVTNPLKSSVQQKQVAKSPSAPSSYATAHHHKCATKIQSLFRGYSLRNEWVKEDAVILIQAAYRGYAERCRVALMLEELFQSGQLELLDD